MAVMELIQQLGTLTNQIQFEIKNADLKLNQIEDLENQINSHRIASDAHLVQVKADCDKKLFQFKEFAQELEKQNQQFVNKIESQVTALKEKDQTINRVSKELFLFQNQATVIDLEVKRTRDDIVDIITRSVLLREQKSTLMKMNGSLTNTLARLRE